MDKLHRTMSHGLPAFWRHRDQAAAVIRFLDLSSIASLPALARSFAADHVRVLVTLAQATPKFKICIMDALSNCGHDMVHFRESWGSLDNWERVASLGDRPGGKPNPDPSFRAAIWRPGFGIALSRFPYLGLDHLGGLVWRASGSRNRVQRLKVHVCYRSKTGGPSFALSSWRNPETYNQHADGRPPFLCRIAFDSPAAPNGVPTGMLANQDRRVVYYDDCSGTQYVLERYAKPMKWYSFEAVFNWETQMVDLLVNGHFWRLPFGPYPLSSVYLFNRRKPGSSSESFFGDIEVDYAVVSTRLSQFRPVSAPRHLPFLHELRRGDTGAPPAL